MQERHNNRNLYFNELAATSRKHFIPYIRRWHGVEAGMSVLEIGCGEGGNLLPFAESGCLVTGVDIAECRIRDAKSFFGAAHAEGEFLVKDILRQEEPERRYDIVICHDVLEHIADKETLLSGLHKYLKPRGVVFMSFPPWQMPFGGHQQICRSGILSRLPFVHLLPASLYRTILKAFGESGDCIRELLQIKRTGISVEAFERMAGRTRLRIHHRQLWLVNPHYETKFGLKPRRLNRIMARVPYVRDFISTSCFYILKGF